MEVQFSPDVESRLQELATALGRPAGEFVEDAMATYFEDLAEVRSVLASRYNEVVSGAILPIDGEEFFDCLRDRERLLLEQRNSR
jgi:hypothetical protein